MSTHSKVAPRISCVIPAYNEAPNLKYVVEATIEALSKLSPSFEVIVVNDGSTDSSQAVMASLLPLHPQLVFIDLSRNFGKEAAMTAGLEQAQGDVIFQIDADGHSGVFHSAAALADRFGIVSRHHRHAVHFLDCV